MQASESCTLTLTPSETTHLRVGISRGQVRQLEHFHFWCLQSDCAQRGFSSRKAALRCPVLFRVEVKTL